MRSNSTSDSEILFGLWPNSVVINSAVSESITSVAVAIIPFFINSLTTSAVFSVILLANSETVIVSGIVTSLNCLIAGVWSACILAFSRLLLIEARDLTLTLSESKARAIVIFPCLFSWKPLFQDVFLTFSLKISFSCNLFPVHSLLLGRVSVSASFCLSFSACRAASSAFFASIWTCFWSSSIFLISSISSVSDFLRANILSFGAKEDAASEASKALAAIRASSILAFSTFSAAIVSASAAVFARPSCNILLLDWISLALSPELFSALVFSTNFSLILSRLDSLFVRLTSTWTVPLPALEFVVILLEGLGDETEFFNVNFPLEERLNFFLSPFMFSSIITIP